MDEKQKPFLLKDDLIERYMKRRPSMSKAEVEDLINTFLDKLEHLMNKKSELNYAFELPKIGHIYIPIHETKKEKYIFKKRFYATLMDIAFNVDSSTVDPLYKAPHFSRRTKAMDLMELMKVQNQIVEELNNKDKK